MKSIVIADDEYDIALALELLLMGEGYRVILASDGMEALKRAGESNPDLIILDVMMPKLTGLEALKILRADPKSASIPVILMSAVLPKVRQEEYRWSAFVRKPFDVDQVLAVIGELLGK